MPLTLELVILGLIVFVTASLGGLAVVGAVLVRLPSNYFSLSYRQRFWRTAHPLLRGIALFLKNLLGIVVLGIGVVLALPGIPGPGVLTILVGLMLMDFPGKRRLERWLIGRPRVLITVNGLRRRFGKSPFILEDGV